MKKTIELKGVDLTSLFGVADSHLKLIEDAFATKLLVRGNEIYLEGERTQIELIREVFHEMIQTLSRKSSLTQDDVRQLIHIVTVDNGHESKVPDTVIHYGRKGAISAKTPGQERYVRAVQENDIVFSVGPAGTGKTFLAVAFAVAALDNHEVDRIILCRPAVEAGESLGFLPGDLKEKVDPYLTPLYDALGEMIPQTRLKPLLAKNIIEVIPLAYMRGRTLNNAFLILDEAQNAATMQMKMFLTRLGVNSRAIITGDITQVDLPRKSDSGLIQVIDILKAIDGIGFVQLTEEDVVRHHLVREIIKAYDRANGS
ncbi:MAG: PhoH family protein [FCB group bacterium]|nr:PhoH family protein [FCB group bacterium]